jgi:hypothetical protein
MSKNMFLADCADCECLHNQGFTEDEVTRLIALKEQIEKQVEYREVVEEQNRLGFLLWLVEHGRISG